MNECKNTSGGTAEWNNKITLLGFCREWQTGKLCPQNAWCVSEVATVTLQLPDPHPTSSGEYMYVVQMYE